MQGQCKKAKGRVKIIVRMLAGIGLGAILSGPLYGQFAGTQDLFQLGAGARAVGLGNSYVAMPYDATAIYWNAAGLDHLQRKNMVFFYTPLIEGAKYNFIGYAHPTLQMGTFGFGIMHLGVGGVVERDSDGRSGSDFSYGQTQFLLSYAKKLPLPLTVGGTLKVERQQLFDGNAGGVGLDVGILYHPDFASSLLRGLTVGMNFQNLIAPRLKLNVATEVEPWRFRFGLAKPIAFGSNETDGINLLFGLETGRDMATRFNMGSEYIFQNRGAIRVGYNGKAINFGAGVLFKNYRFDYAFGKFGNDGGEFAVQHRFSLTVEIGRTRRELIELNRKLEMQRIEEETARQVNLRNRLDYENYMNRGKTYYKQDEYFIALLRFSSAKDLFPEDKEANYWVQKARQKLEEQQQQEMTQLKQQERQQAAQEAKEAFINDQYSKGMQYLQAGKYQQAITEWERGLAIDPENELLKSWIEKTRAEIRNKAADVLGRARSAEKNGRISRALELYGQALDNLSNPKDRARVDAKIAELRQRLTFNDLYRKGLTEYLSKNYVDAQKTFAEVLKLAPNDPKVKKYYDDAEARANARIEDFANEETRRKYLEAVKLIQQEGYSEALQILEKLQKQQRYNKRILDAIDLARERMQKK